MVSFSFIRVNFNTLIPVCSFYKEVLLTIGLYLSLFIQTMNSILHLLLLPGLQVVQLTRMLPAAMLPMAQFRASLLSLTQLDGQDGCEHRCKHEPNCPSVLEVAPFCRCASVQRHSHTDMYLSFINARTLKLCHT